MLDKVAKRAQAEARALLVQIPYAGTKKEAEKLRKRFAARYRSQFPAAVETLERDWDRMVTFYDFPKEHWKHLRTTNVVESPFKQGGADGKVILSPAEGRTREEAYAQGRREPIQETHRATLATTSLRSETLNRTAGRSREDGRLISFTHLLT